MFRLPVYQELSEAQVEVFNMPVKGSHLVIGPPGTGKTVIAIYRAEMLKSANECVQFVVYNNTLNQYLETALKEKGLSNTTSTFHRWFPAWYKTCFNEAPPLLEPFKYDWLQIYRTLGAKNRSITRFPNLIIDEGQDFPKELYMVMSLLVENLTVFADENQRIWDTNSTINEIKHALGVDRPYCLKTNYRNSLPIAKLAREFYTGLQTGMPDLPDKAGIPPKVIFATEQQQMNIIVNYTKNNPEKHVGVFVPRKDIMASMYQRMHGRVNDVQLQMYYSDDPAFRTIYFHHTGIKLVTYASTKGLEFDTVFIPCLQKVRTDANREEAKMKFYVLSSRAREELVYMTSDPCLPDFMTHIPSTLYEKVDLRSRSRR